MLAAMKSGYGGKGESDDDDDKSPEELCEDVYDAREDKEEFCSALLALIYACMDEDGDGSGVVLSIGKK